MSDKQSFQQFMKQREAAAAAYTSGDPAPLKQLAAQQLPVTFFGPRGGKITGAQEVWKKYEQDAAAFQPGSETHFEILQLAESDDVAYWVGFQHATVRMQGSTEPQKMSLRVTEVFRRETGTLNWKLVHRHADPLADASAPKS